MPRSRWRSFEVHIAAPTRKKLQFVDSAAVVDGVMVSARAWSDHPEWMREFIQILRAKSPAV